MVNARKVAQLYLQGQITMNPTPGMPTPPSPGVPSRPGKPGDKPAVPKSNKMERLEKDRAKLEKNISKQKQMDVKEYQKLQQNIDKSKSELNGIMGKKGAITKIEPAIAVVEDPKDLYKNNVQTILASMKLKDEVIKEATLVGPVKGELRLYQVPMKRKGIISIDNVTDSDTRKYFQKVFWDSAGMMLQVWAPYEAPETTETAENVDGI